MAKETAEKPKPLPKDVVLKLENQEWTCKGHTIKRAKGPGNSSIYHVYDDSGCYVAQTLELADVVNCEFYKGKTSDR